MSTLADSLPARRHVLNLGLLATAVTILVLFSSYGRPIWTDEFLHFAMGGLVSVRDAMAVVRESTSEINHGQTGFYMLLDHVLLKQIGANSLVLRLPSLVSAAYMLYVAIVFLRNEGIGYLGQFALLVALLGQRALMYFAGEARPYMPLAAAAVGVLAYYSTPAERRARRHYLAIGWIGVLLGCLMHPFFPVYWLGIAVFAYVRAHPIQRRQAPELRTFLAFVNIPLTIVGAVITLSIGAYTWLQGAPEFTYDPFEFTSQSGGFVPTFIAASHFQFLPARGPLTELALYGPFLALAAFAFVPARFKQVLRGMVAPIALLALALGLSLVFSGLSYLRDYWILPRQWVASMALVPIASVWLAAELLKILAAYRRQAAWVSGALLLLVVAGMAVRAGKMQMDSLREWDAARGTRFEVPASTTDTDQYDMNDWLKRANNNVRDGGPVLSIFAKFYGK